MHFGIDKVEGSGIFLPPTTTFQQWSNWMLKENLSWIRSTCYTDKVRMSHRCYLMELLQIKAVHLICCQLGGKFLLTGAPFQDRPNHCQPFPPSVSSVSLCLAVTTGRLCKVQPDGDGVTFQITMIKLPIQALPSSTSEHESARTRRQTHARAYLMTYSLTSPPRGVFTQAHKLVLFSGIGSWSVIWQVGYHWTLGGGNMRPWP